MVARMIPRGLIPYNLRRPLATLSMLGGVTAIAAGMVFLTQTLLARHLGPASYGLFASSLVTVTMVAPLAGFGLFQFRLKAYGVEGWAANRWLAPSLRFTALSTAIALALVVAWALAGPASGDTRFTLLVLSPVVLGTLCVNIVTNKLRLEERFAQMAAWQLAIPGSRLLVASMVLFLPLEHRSLAVAYSAIAILVGLSTLPHLRALLRGDMDLKGYGPRVPPTGPPLVEPSLGKVWSEAWAYGLVALLYPIFFQISTVLLKYLGSDEEAGHYGIAMAIMTAVYLIPTTIYQKYLLAKLHRWAAHDRPRFFEVYRKAAWAMLGLGLLIAAGLATVAPSGVPLVFGAPFRPVVPILMVLAFCVPIRFLSTAVASVLLTEHHMRYRVYTTALATVLVVMLNGLLIPRSGALGAAVATVVGEAVLLLATWYCVRRFVAPAAAGS